MKHTGQRDRQRKLNDSNCFRVHQIAVACSTLLLSTLSAQAQQAEPVAEKQEAVIVTGIRHSIETSVTRKKEADSIVDSISAEDIGKLPDVSIAESIARIPGIAAQRVDGRAQVLSIRGLGPRYGATLLNGREMVSTGDNRSVEYDQFPGELFNRVDVYKTSKGNLLAQGLSGTVDMEVVRPLSVASRQIVLNLQGENNSNGKLNADTRALGGKLSATYIDKFANNTLGLALGYAHLDNPGQEKHYKSWWWANTAKWGAQVPGTPADAIALMGFETGVASTKRVRDGVMAVVEYKPNKDFSSMLDLYYSKFDQKETRRTIMSDMGPWAGTTYTGATTSLVGGDSVVTGGTVNGLKPVVLSSQNVRKDETFAAGWNNKLKLGNWTAVADLSYSKAKRDEVNAELEAGLAAPTSFTNVNIATGADARSAFTPTVNFADPNLVQLRDPAGWGRDGRSQFPKVKDEMKSLRLSGSRGFDSFINNFEGGVNYSERTKNMNRTEVNYNLKNGRAPVSVGSDLLVSPTSLASSGFAGDILSFNFNSVLDRYYDSTPTALDQGPGRIWDVKEKVTTVYSMVNFDFDTKLPITGNAGLQVIHADQSSNGLFWDTKTKTTSPLTEGKAYTDLVPSLNVKTELAKDAYLRLGWARMLARPNMEDMRAGVGGLSISNNTAPTTTPDTRPHILSASGGNPELEPWRANTYDVSIEKYFGKRSYIGLAAFHKNVLTFVYSQTDTNYDFTGFPNPSSVVTPYNPTKANNYIGNFSRKANGKGGSIDGLEVSAAVEGALIHPSLDGFGAIFSASDTSSTLHEDNDPKKKLDGLSGTLLGWTLYYEKSGFSARVAQRYRSRFETTVRDPFNNNVSSAILNERITDLQFGYSFETGPLKGLSLNFQINNLNDTPYRTNVGISVGSSDPNALLPERYTTYGRKYLFGVTYKM